MSVSELINHGVGPLGGTPPTKVHSAGGGAGKTPTKGKDAGEDVRLDRAEFDRISRENARTLQAAKLVLDALPDVRADKVELAQRRLKEGFYDRPDVRAAIAAQMAADPEARPGGDIAPERSANIKHRLAEGYYNRPEARDKIVRGMIDDALQE